MLPSARRCLSRWATRAVRAWLTEGSTHSWQQESENLTRLPPHNPAGRLGCWKGGTRDVTTHEFFRAIAWNDLEAKKIKMAYVPKITNPLDTSNFDDYPDADPDAHTWDKYVDASYETIWASEFGS